LVLPRARHSPQRVVLAGTIDVHVHSYPDDRPGPFTPIDVAKLSQTRGMRAIVLKKPLGVHRRDGVSRAAVSCLVSRIFGGIALNLTDWRHHNAASSRVT
jgi:hypothetical protein